MSFQTALEMMRKSNLAVPRVKHVAQPIRFAKTEKDAEPKAFFCESLAQAENEMDTIPMSDPDTIPAPTLEHERKPCWQQHPGLCWVPMVHGEDEKPRGGGKGRSAMATRAAESSVRAAPTEDATVETGELPALPPSWKVPKMNMKQLKDILRPRGKLLTGCKSSLVQRVFVSCYAPDQLDTQEEMQAKALAIRRTALGLIKPKEPEEEAPATQEEPPQEDPPQEAPPQEDPPQEAPPQKKHKGLDTVEVDGSGDERRGSGDERWSMEAVDGSALDQSGSEAASPKPIVIEDIDHGDSDDSDWGPWTKHGKRQTIVVEDIDHADIDHGDSD